MRISMSFGATALMTLTLALAACGETGPADRSDAPRVTAPLADRAVQPRHDPQAPAGAAAALAGRFQALQQSIARETQAYNAAIGSINDRLQAGTTPANRDLIAQWNAAQANLDQVTADLGRLNTLAADVARQAATAGSMASSPRPTGTGRRPPRAAESDANRAAQDLNRLKGEVDSEIARQNSFLQTERPTLATLGYAINAGRPGPVRTAGGARH